MNVLGRAGLAVCALLCCAGAHAADLAGEIVRAIGIVTAYTSGGNVRVVGAKSALFVGDVVSTGPRSLAQLELSDGTRMTLRPETTFEISAFSLEESKESAVFTLFKGGLRAVTGFLSKRNPDAVRLKTAVATIGIRGTELDVRLCDDKCRIEAARRPTSAGRAGFIKGRVLVRALGGRGRTLRAGDAVYVGDTLITGASAYAVVAFRDDSRVTLLPNTEFTVDDLTFDVDRPDDSSAAFRLLRGGLRAISGFIGKQGQGNYRMRTSVATIGIRGTGFDLLCQGSCQNPDINAGPDGDGLFATPWEGAITIDDVNVVETGETVFIADRRFTPLLVPAMPTVIAEPKPNDVALPPAPTPPASSSTPGVGLYVSCYAGNCAVETDGNTVELEAGQASYVGAAGSAEALSEIPAFQAEDPLLQAVEIGLSPSEFNQTLDSGVLECTVR